ncbi:hypothetical protein ES288_A07G124800v1 [Gossypium darwinii]|uniref:Raptor N-terminal CASPase-like domain-containing protein n=1 Tax=Gossypium darwinii TaxID=34276 RepID=A0A5D2FX46_GOSDA|nr:hypothetical protein ES288_A07G124800v1 [Gossypium darwinii]
MLQICQVREFYFITMDMVFQSQLQMSYTQYIPFPISNLDSLLKTPFIYVFDCSAAGMVVCLPSLALSAAGMVVNAFIELLDCGTSNYPGSSRDCILLAACEAHETLPQSAEFPAYVHTLAFCSGVLDSLAVELKASKEFSKLYAGIAILWLHISLNQPSVVYCFFFSFLFFFIFFL